MATAEQYAEKIADRINYDDLNDSEPHRIEKSLAVSIFTMLVPVVLKWCMSSEEASPAEMRTHVVDDYNHNRERQRRRTARKIRRQNPHVSRDQSYKLADAMIAEAIETPVEDAEAFAASCIE